MLWRYVRSTFLFWFTGIFAAVGLITLLIGLYVSHSVSGGNTYFMEFEYAGRDGPPAPGNG